MLIYFINNIYNFLKPSPLKKLQVGTIFETSGYDKNRSRAKVLAIDIVNNQKIFSINLNPIGEPTYTTSKSGQKINISSIGHLPVSEKTLKNWGIKIIGQENVSDSELEGYKIWKESAGGAF